MIYFLNNKAELKGSYVHVSKQYKLTYKM